MGGLFAEDGDGDLRVLPGGEADEDTVVGAAGGVLGGTGLGADGDLAGPLIGIGVLAAAEVFPGGAAGHGDHSAHTLGIGLEGGVGDGHLADHLRAVGVDQGPVVRGGDPVQEGGPVPDTLGGQGAGVDAHLQGGESVLGLADGGQDSVAAVPGRVNAGVGGFFTFPVGPPAHLLHQLDAGRLAQA